LEPFLEPFIAESTPKTPKCLLLGFGLYWQQAAVVAVVVFVPAVFARARAAFLLCQAEAVAGG
jgi:hypothetical protein